MAILRDGGTFETWLPSAARIASGSVDLGAGRSSSEALRVQLHVTAASGTLPTLDVVIEDSFDGANWNAVGTFAQRTAAGRQVIDISAFVDRLRVRWTITGGTPSFTFSVLAYVK